MFSPIIYRQTEGVIKATGKSLPSHPSYSHICKRINKRLNVELGSSSSSIDDDYIIIAVDSTGTKVTNRVQWMSDKWGLGKKGYLKIHIAVNIRTKEVLALDVTADEKVHDGKIMEKLVENVLKINHDKKTIKSLLCDGAYDSNYNFRFLNEKKINSIIKVKRNSVISSRNNTIRNKEVISQTKDFLKWKKKRSKDNDGWLKKLPSCPSKERLVNI